MSPDVDVLVAGGGPVGLFAAIEARRRGLSVVVVEPRLGSIDKACGEGLMPTAVARLRAAGVEVAGRPFRGIRYVDGTRQVVASFRTGSGLGVRRTTLHAALSSVADELRVGRVHGRVREVTQEADGVRATGVSARWLLAADGLHSAVRREVGLYRRPGGRPRFGLRRHFHSEPWSDAVEVHWAVDGEAYVTPVGDCLVGVAVLTGPGRSFEESMAAFPQLAARLRGAEPASEVRGAGPLRQRAGGVHRGRVLLVGDAAGYVDALTGEGLATGFGSALAAVDAVARGRPDQYPGAWSRETRRSRLLTTGLLAATSRRGPRRALVPVASRVPAGFSAVVDLLR